jgi:hypothetical protein
MLRESARPGSRMGSRRSSVASPRPSQVCGTRVRRPGGTQARANSRDAAAAKQIGDRSGRSRTPDGTRCAPVAHATVRPAKRRPATTITHDNQWNRGYWLLSAASLGASVRHSPAGPAVLDKEGGRAWLSEHVSSVARWKSATSTYSVSGSKMLCQTWRARRRVLTRAEPYCRRPPGGYAWTRGESDA